MTFWHNPTFITILSVIIAPIIVFIIKNFINKLKLEIFVGKTSIETYKSNYETYTEVKLNATIKNKGNKETTIYKITFKSNNENFTNIKLNNKHKNLTQHRSQDSFQKIRIKKNDSIDINLTYSSNDFLDSFKEKKAKIIFETTDKTITKETLIELKKIKE